MGAIAVVAGLIGAAAVLQRVRDTGERRAALVDETLYVQSGKTLQRLTAGYNALAADLYWIRSIQHYGGRRLRLTAQTRADTLPVSTSGDYPLLFPLLDLTTTLDPHFNIAYRFGSLFLAEPRPGGAGRPDLAIKLLEKGIRARPDKWEYMQDIGFVYYWWHQDYPAAASWFNRAAETPGAPWFLKALAATTLAEGGDRRTSRTMWESIRQTADNDWLRRESERRLQQFDALDAIDALQTVVDAHIRRTGVAPDSWDRLIRDGVVRGIPADPTGVPFELEPSGKVTLSRGSSLYPLFTEPRRIGASHS